MKVLVTGATGLVGQHIVSDLLTSGHDVRALTRKPDHADLPPEAEIVGGDLADQDSVAHALKGIDKVHLFLSGNAAPHQHQQIAHTLEQSTVEHVVGLSSASAGGDQTNIIAQLHLSAEQAVRDCGIPYTFLRPGGYMSNALEWADSIKNEGVVRAPFGHLAKPDVHPHDIAEVAVAALTGRGHEGKVYPLSGPELLTAAEQVKILIRTLGRDIRFEDIPEATYIQTMGQWMPAEIVAAIVDLTKQAGAQDPQKLLWSTVADVTGHPARTFKQWCVDNSKKFA